MSEDELKAIETRLNAPRTMPSYFKGNKNDRVMRFLTFEDGEFIAHASEDITALIAEVRRLSGENARRKTRTSKINAIITECVNDFVVQKASHQTKDRYYTAFVDIMEVMRGEHE